jgi:hypothetical protein
MRTILGSAAALIIALAVAGLACSDSDDATDTASGRDGAGGGGGGGGDTGAPARCTTAEECDDGDECTEDTCSAVGVCQHTALTGTQPLYTACSRHCDCDTGYCYDEGYLHPFRYCTRPCGGVSQGCGPDSENVCLLIAGPWADTLDPPVTLRAFCMAVCTSDAYCQAIDPAWDGCTPGPTTLTDPAGNEHTLSLRRTCIKN